MSDTGNGRPDAELATRIAKLWPHREHEANGALGLLCRMGVHRWRSLDVAAIVPDKSVLYCFWCSKVKIDQVIYDP